jgi:hypothetical protein
LFSYKASSQSIGKAFIYIDPLNSIIRLDSALITFKRTPYILGEGKHIIKAWAPKRKLLVDTIHVKANTTQIFTRKLEYTNEYQDYKKKLNAYRTSQALLKYLPGPIVIAFGIKSYLSFKSYKESAAKDLSSANAAYASYENAIGPSDIESYKNSFNEYKEMYENDIKKMNRIKKNSYIFLPAATVLATSLFIISKKFKRPIYSEIPLFSLNSIFIDPGSQIVGVRINIISK